MSNIWNSWSIEFKRKWDACEVQLTWAAILCCWDAILRKKVELPIPTDFPGRLVSLEILLAHSGKNTQVITTSLSQKIQSWKCLDVSTYSYLFAVIFRWHIVFLVVLKMTAMIFSIAEVSRKRPVSGASNYSNRCGGTVVWGRLWGMSLGWIKPQVEHFNLFGLNVLLELWLKATLLACD